MHMKRIYLSILLLGVSIMIQAQEYSFKPETQEGRKLIQLDLDMGVNFDLAYRREGNLLTALSAKKTTYPAINFRIQHFFVRKWGWYLNVKFGISTNFERNCYADMVRKYEAEYYVNSTLAGYQQEAGVNSCLDGGVVYRMTHSRWTFYPRFGFGFGFNEFQTVFAELKKKGGNELYKIEYYGKGGKSDNEMVTFVLSMGFSANYKLSRHCYLLMNVNYAQPLGRQTCYADVINIYNSEFVERKAFKGSTIARDLNVSIGIGFPIYLGKHKREKNSRKERIQRIMEQKRDAYGLFPAKTK